MTYNFVGFALLSVLAFLFVPVLVKQWLRIPQAILLGAIAVRALGSLIRYEVLYRFYGGVGDAVAYYFEGLEVARRLWRFDLGPLSPLYWFDTARWWGTPFLEKLAGLAVAMSGPSMRSSFFLFSLAAFAGLVMMAVAFQRSMSVPASIRFATFLLLWPSLWFWPGSIGKEAVTFLAVGLTTLGAVGKRESVSWLPLVSGLLLAFAIRPHVAVVLAFALAVQQWTVRRERINTRAAAEALVLVLVLVVALAGMTQTFGSDERFQLGDDGNVVDFLGFWAGQSTAGGSRIAVAPLGLVGIPVAFANIWLRPFPWEIGNPMMALAFAELAVFWWLVARNRNAVWLTLKNWRHSRILRFALPLLLAYTLLIGFTFGNLGIIARQRTPVYPCMLMVLCAMPRPVLRTGSRR